MGKVRKQNLFNTIIAAFKFLLFWMTIIIQLPIIFCLPIGRVSVGYSKFFIWQLMKLVGVKTRVYGKLSSNRPLMVVANHISIFEAGSFATVFGGGFFGKKEIEKFPIIGWMLKKLGMIFIDRRPTHALDALRRVENQMKKVPYPMFLFPEGTTTNGGYVKKFKSTLFQFMDADFVTVQPVVINYRYLDSAIIDEETMANDFAYFDNVKQDLGLMCKRERSAFGQIFHMMVIGGALIEVTVLPPPILNNMDRKEIANTLYKIVSDKYMELKNKKN